MFTQIKPADVRRRNLRYLVEKYGQADVARALERPDRQIADILAERSSFGEKIARRMEEAWLKNRKEKIFLDSAGPPHEVEESADGSHAPEDKQEPQRTVSWIAVAGQARLGENGWYEEIQTLGADGFVEAHSSDREAYALRVKGDSMFPAIRDGWYVVVEPNSPAKAGEYVAIALADGRKMVKEFLFAKPDGVAVQSVNGGGRLTLSNEEILTVHAVSSVLMPSKHRLI